MLSIATRRIEPCERKPLKLEHLGPRNLIVVRGSKRATLAASSNGAPHRLRTASGRGVRTRRPSEATGPREVPFQVKKGKNGPKQAGRSSINPVQGEEKHFNPGVECG